MPWCGMVGVPLRGRCTDEGYGVTRTRRTLHFLLHSDARRTGRADYVDPKNVPEFEGDTAWFEVEKIERGDGHRWP